MAISSWESGELGNVLVAPERPEAYVNALQIVRYIRGDDTGYRYVDTLEVLTSWISAFENAGYERLDVLETFNRLIERESRRRQRAFRVWQDLYEQERLRLREQRGLYPWELPPAWHAKHPEPSYRVTLSPLALCGACRELTFTRAMTSVPNGYGDRTDVCNSCLRDNYTWCDRCDSYRHEDDDHDHPELGSHCEAPAQTFRFPSVISAAGSIANDERITVSLPAGYISESGMAEVKMALYEHFSRVAVLGSSDPYHPDGRVLWSDDSKLDSIGNQWSMREGNFTKRLAKLALQNDLKLTPEVITRIGNIAMRHTTKTSKLDVAFTRDLNQHQSAFVNDDSCWWGGYSESRCNLKQYGGLALREFRGNRVHGRAWVLPLHRSGRYGLEPIPAALDKAVGFFVFNVYGIEEIAAVQAVSVLTGKPYRKVGIENDEYEMFINSSRGFLVADQATLDETEEITLTFPSRCDCEHSE